MLEYEYHRDPKTQVEWIETELRGKALLLSGLLNKGTAFSQDERLALDLIGKLPYSIESIEEQLIRAYAQYVQYDSDLQKYVYLNNLHDKNEVLFYRLIIEHAVEMVPIIYTPVVGEAVRLFHREFRQPRGLYIAYPDQDRIDSILQNRTHPNISVTVVTDGERVLGIGDQGAGAIHIPVAKLALYSLAGIDPYHTLPIVLDVGTNNEALLNDPFYLGWRHPRMQGKAYDRFIETFVHAFEKQLPHTFLHWEDFGRENARRILEKYQHKLCTFNGDLQGTSVVAMAALLTAMQRIEAKLCEQKVVIFGAGTAGVGIADRIKDGMIREGMSASAAEQMIWLVDRQGLLTDQSRDIQPFHKPYLKTGSPEQSFETVMHQVNPSILIGCSTLGGAFTESIIRRMASKHRRPIIFPLSNPTEQSEAKPSDLLAWTQGHALIATGSPFTESRPLIAQCNNFFAFPGIGLGVIAAKARSLSPNMLWTACETLSRLSPRGPYDSLLPPLKALREVAYEIAMAVAKTAGQEGLSDLDPSISIEQAMKATFWEPHYRAIKPRKKAS
jgi:malate dehydrogenase (oxaloacetate-decarboxylating)